MVQSIIVAAFSAVNSYAFMNFSVEEDCGKSPALCPHAASLVYRLCVPVFLFQSRILFAQAFNKDPIYAILS